MKLAIAASILLGTCFLVSCDSSTQPEPASAPVAPQLSLSSGNVTYGTVLKVTKANAQDSLFKTSDTSSWSKFPDSVITVKTSATYYFKSRRNGQESPTVKISLTVLPDGPALAIGSRSYRTVYIGGKHWMAENLDEGTMVPGAEAQANDTILEKYCRGDSVENCTKCGGLYLLAEALAIPSACNGTYCAQFNTVSARGICPSGWHVASAAEWTNVASAAGGWSNLYGNENGSSTYPDPYKFSLLGGGSRNTNGTFAADGVVFWTSTLFVNKGTILYGAGSTTTFWGNSTGAAIRCVDDL